MTKPESGRPSQTGLSEWRDPEHCVRIEVTCWHPLSPADDQFVERRKNLRVLWNYWRRIGTRAILLKVRSRLGEAARNRRFAAIGSGRILETTDKLMAEVGSAVLFFAPNHPSNPHSVVLHADLILPTAELRVLREASPGNLTLPDSITALVGWSPYSGISIRSDQVRSWLESLRDNHFKESPEVIGIDGQRDDLRSITRIEKPMKNSGKPSAVLFGLGNYAKTQIVPYIHQKLQLACVHEIDVDQIRTANDWGATLDTSPGPRKEERYDAWFIAGYHHMHADIALEALRRGAYAIVEKPMATTRTQFEQIRQRVESAGLCRLITCYQRRYSPMNEWIREDMNLEPGAPVNFHCIVYEIPLPIRHWYNWPASRSRITSNGCHWIDHFLYLNDYQPVLAHDVRALSNGDYVILLELTNGAYFTMTLTQSGSERLGVRDYVELRRGDVTVQIVDQSKYFAESTTRKLRSRTMNLTANYTTMYRKVVDTIVRQESGDSLESLASTIVTIELEEALANAQTLG